MVLQNMDEMGKLCALYLVHPIRTVFSCIKVIFSSASIVASDSFTVTYEAENSLMIGFFFLTVV